jgi:exosortase A-associated hydrolase 1
MAQSYAEQPVSFDCRGETLIGVIAAPARPLQRGVVVVVGGPQYRIGSHRQFVLLARHLAARGIACMRFDVRGMGDSSGTLRTFEDIHSDIEAAIERFFSALPNLREVVLWGLCDAASAALFYAVQDARVRGLVLLNPWVRTSAGEARAYLRHYYLQRLVSGEFWRKLSKGEFDAAGSVRDLLGKVRSSMRRTSAADRCTLPTAVVDSSLPLPERMAACLQRFRGEVLLVLSGNDLTAKEFLDAAGASETWRKLLQDPRVTRRDLPAATHTFSSREWRDQVADWTHEWLLAW